MLNNTQHGTNERTRTLLCSIRFHICRHFLAHLKILEGSMLSPQYFRNFRDRLGKMVLIKKEKDLGKWEREKESNELDIIELIEEWYELFLCLAEREFCISLVRSIDVLHIDANNQLNVRKMSQNRTYIDRYIRSHSDEITARALLMQTSTFQ